MYVGTVSLKIKSLAKPASQNSAIDPLALGSVYSA